MIFDVKAEINKIDSEIQRVDEELASLESEIRILDAKSRRHLLLRNKRNAMYNVKSQLNSINEIEGQL